jgi:hypothetical protein
MLTLLWQVFVILGCCLAAGSSLLFLVPRDCSLLSKVFFSSTAGIFLAVLIPQNLIYLGVPVRISAWLLFGVAALQLCRRSRRLGDWIRSVRSNADIRALGVVVLLTVTFHSVVPVQQGIDSFYGRAGIDQINYVFLAEFLKEETYKTDFQDIGLRPWLLMGLSFKHQRIGQSIITAEISVLSLTNAKNAYTATFIFFLTALAMCFYFLLREIGVDHLAAGLGGFLPAIFPGITHLFLYGFLSQTAALFVFAFFATLLYRRDLNGRSFTVFFSLGLAYLIAVYSEMAPVGVGCFLLGLIFVRRENFRQKWLMSLCGSVLVALLNPFYIYNLICFLSQQYFLALHETSLKEMLPSFLSLRGWSAVLFGPADPRWTLLVEFCGVVFALLALTGFLLLPRSEKLVFGSVLLPVVTLAAYLSTRVPLPVYPITKLLFSFSPFAAVFVFSVISRLSSTNGNRILEQLRTFISVVLVVGAALGSIEEYRQVVANFSDSGLLREPGFMNVCRRLELANNREVLLFDTNRYILGWLCYHARNNDVYCDARAIGTVDLLRPFSFSVVPKLDSLDLVVSRDRIIDPKTANPMCGTLIDSFQEPDHENGKVRYWLGPPAHVRLLALHAISANIVMRLEPGPDAKTLPIRFSLSRDNEIIAQGSFSDESVEVQRIELPRGLSDFKLSVSAERVEVRAAGLPLHIAKLDDFQVGDIELISGE